MTDHPPAPPYSRYAEVYDRGGQRAFGQRMAVATLDWLRAHGRAPRRVADLACGTGAATLTFAAAGLDTVGVDRSPAMLARAAAAAAAAGLPVRLVEQDIRGLALPDRYDLVTCSYDSLNYLTEGEDLRRVFGCVAGVLAGNGVFAFDLNTRRKLAAWAAGAFVAVDDADLFGIHQPAYDATTHLSPLRMTFFVRAGDDPGRWERFDEEHLERGYALSEIEGLLAAAGLRPIAILDVPNNGGAPRGPGSEESLRVLFVAVPAPPETIGRGGTA